MFVDISSIILLHIQDKVPQESLPILRDRLDAASSEQIDSLVVAPLKSPVVGFIFGLFLGVFGVDRFYKGDKKLALAKLVVFIVGVLMSAIGSIVLFALIIWVCADFYYVWKGIQRDNLDLLLQILTTTA